MRILYVVSQWGAPTETFVRREADAARCAGHNVVALSLKAPPPGADRATPVVCLSWGAVVGDLLRVLLKNPATALRALGRATRRSRRSTIVPNLTSVAVGIAADRRLPEVDWVHAHFAWVAASAADGLAAVRRQPFSVFAHAFDIFDERFIDRYTTDKLQRAAFVAVESEAIRAEVNQRFQCDAAVARMGVPTAWVVDRAEGRQPDPGCILTVGSLLPKKGHDVLIQAVARVPGSRLEIAGGGPARDELLALASGLGLADRIALLGSLTEDEIKARLDQAAVFCLASLPTPSGDRDGVPNVLIEAMARAVPVVSTAVSGIPDLLGDGRGQIVPPGDLDALAAALTEVLDHPDRSVVAAHAALEHVRAHYRTEVNWAALEARIVGALGR